MASPSKLPTYNHQDVEIVRQALQLVTYTAMDPTVSRQDVSARLLHVSRQTLDVLVRHIRIERGLEQTVVLLQRELAEKSAKLASSLRQQENAELLAALKADEVKDAAVQTGMEEVAGEEEEMAGEDEEMAGEDEM